MKAKHIPGLIILVVAGIIISASFMAPQEPSAKEIVRKADENLRGESSKGTMTMNIVRPGWSRSITMKMWSKGDEYAMIYITEPAKEKGKVFLKREDEMWSWVPSINRMIKMPPSMMMQSWMGSDFKNDDLVKQSSIVKDYMHTLLRSETLRGHDCWVIDMIPNPDAPVVWGKITTWVTKTGYHMIKGLYYDEDDFLVHTENGYDIRRMGDRDMVTRMTIVPSEEPGNKTELIFTEMEFDFPITESFFTQQNMKRVR